MMPGLGSEERGKDGKILAKPSKPSIGENKDDARQVRRPSYMFDPQPLLENEPAEWNSSLLD